MTTAIEVEAVKKVIAAKWDASIPNLIVWEALEAAENARQEFVSISCPECVKANARRDQIFGRLK